MDKVSSIEKRIMDSQEFEKLCYELEKSGLADEENIDCRLSVREQKRFRRVLLGEIEKDQIFLYMEKAKRLGFNDFFIYSRKGYFEVYGKSISE